MARQQKQVQLSDEDLARIEAEERARLEIRKRIENEKATPAKKQSGCGGTLLIALVFVGIGFVVVQGMSNSGSSANSSSRQSTQSPTTTPTRNEAPAAEGVVSSALTNPNPLGIDQSDLESAQNPKGAGAFVFVSRTRFEGIAIERVLAWFVIDDQAFPLNGATKNLTPELDWLRDSPPSLTERGGFSDPNEATSYGLDLLFPDR